MISNPLNTPRLFWIYLLVLGLLGIGLAGYTTAPYGAGVGTDGAIQISTAEHLIRGQGFFDYSNEPFVRWPPLYPLLLAGLGKLTGVDPYILGWYLNVFLFGVMIWLGGALLYIVFREHLQWAYLGSLIIATSISLLSLAANVGTDPLFIALVWAFLLVTGGYLRASARAEARGPEWQAEWDFSQRQDEVARYSLGAMAVLAVLASLQRLPGVIVPFTGGAAIVIAGRAKPQRAVIRAMIFETLTLLPFAAWILGHNYLGYGTFFDVNPFEYRYPFQNLGNLLAQMLHWFAPYRWLTDLQLACVAGALFLLVVVLSRRADWERLLQRLAQPTAWIALLFSAFYLAFVTFTMNSIDTRFIFYDRYQIVLLAPVLILLLGLFQDVIAAGILKRFHLPVATAWAVGGLLCAIWLSYPFHNVAKYVARTRMDGDLTYNRYNTREMRRSEVVQVLEKIAAQDEGAIYSNYPAAAWFYTRRTALSTPRGSIWLDLNVPELMKTYQGWPYDQPGTLVWFLPNDYDHVLPPAILAQMADLEKIYSGPDGEVYRVTRR